MQKTVKEWFQYAKEMGFIWANHAIRECQEDARKVDSLGAAIFSGFDWTKNGKGEQYWNGVYATLVVLEAQQQSTAQTLQTSPDRATIAAMALQGLLGDSEFEAGPKAAAEAALKYADALIAELEKPAKDDPF